MPASLFDQSHELAWPAQQKFPVNEPSQGYNVHYIVSRDIEDAAWLYIITGFTSLSNLVKFFGDQNFVRTPIKLTTLRRSKLTTCFAGEEKGFTHEMSGV